MFEKAALKLRAFRANRWIVAPPPHDAMDGEAAAAKRRRAMRMLPLAAASLGAATAEVYGRSVTSRATTSPSQINILSMGADPTGQSDSSPAFLAAANALPSTGGSLLIPAGIYKNNSQVDLPSKSISLVGDGINASIIAIMHNGVGFNFQPQSQKFPATFAASNLGFSPIGRGGRPQSAIYVSLPSDDPIQNNPSCTLCNIDLGVDLVGGEWFYNGITLMNVWRSMTQNVSHHGPGAAVVGSTFITLAGFSIDNRFLNCIVDGSDVAYLSGSYTEGIHIANPILAGCTNAVVVGPRVPPYGSNNALGLYISGGELNCIGPALQLSQMWGGWISDTHLSSSGDGPVIQLAGSIQQQIINCSISGNGDSTAGIQFEVTQQSGCAANVIDSCIFTNIGQPIILAPGVANNTGMNLRWIGTNSFPLLQPSGLVNDLSGNVTNNFSWLTGLSGPGRIAFLH